MYACADDIGASLKNLKSLRILFRLFELFRKATRLSLKSSKCVGIVASIDLNDFNLRMIGQFLARLIPERKNFQLECIGKYFGIFTSPDLGGISWEGSMIKAFARVEETSSNKPPLALACRSLNARTLSVLGYGSRLRPPPPGFKVFNSEWQIKLCVWPPIHLTPTLLTNFMC